MGDKSKKGQRFLVALTVVSVLVIIAVLLVGMVQGSGLNAKVAAAKKVGFPFDGKDLVPKSSYPPSQNAAVNYLNLAPLERAARTTKSVGRTIVEKFPRTDVSVADANAIRAYLSTNAALIDEYQFGAAKPYCYFEKDWEKGWNVAFPEYSDVKNATRTVLARAYLRAEGGDVKGASADMGSVARTSRHLASQPTLIALLVSIAMESMEAKTIESLLPAAAKDKRLADALRTQATGLTDKWDLTDQIRCEAFFMWWSSEHLHDFGSMTGMVEPIEIRLTKNSQTVVRVVKSSVLDIYTPALRDYRPFDDERNVLAGIELRFNKAKADSYLARYYLEVLMPMWGGVPDLLDRARSRKLSLAAALEVIEYRRSHGAWPKSLAEAGGSYLDPFDGKPLRYKPDGQGFRVWSVGINGKDDGGKTREETRTDDHDEVIVFAPRVK